MSQTVSHICNYAMFIPFNMQDEIFHIPQAQHYCRGEFSSWDPKITTFPGLYLYSSALPALLKLLHLHSDSHGDSGSAGEVGFCSPQFLRLTVLLSAAAIPLVAARCRQAVSFCLLYSC
jgi:hypothetical protein